MSNLDPVQKVLAYEEHRFELLAIYEHDGSVDPHKLMAYSGPPRQELEDAWDDLMHRMNRLYVLTASYVVLGRSGGCLFCNFKLRNTSQYKDDGEFAEDNSIIKLANEAVTA